MGPQDVTAAFQSALGQREFEHKSMMDLLGLMPEAQAPEPLDQPFIITDRGVMSLREFNGLPTDWQRYYLGTEGARLLGSSEIPTKDEFDSMKKTDQELLIEHASTKPELRKGLEWLANLRRPITEVNIGNEIAGILAKAKTAQEVYFEGYKWVNDANEYKNSNEVISAASKAANMIPENELKGKSDEEVAALQENARKIAVADKMIEHITSQMGGASNIKLDVEGNTLVFRVTWPSGNTGVYRFPL